jgi:hypothetical protein
MGRPARKYVKRVQTMLTEQQYDLLQEYAQEINKPLGALVCEAVEKSLIISVRSLYHISIFNTRSVIFAQR